MRGAATTQPGNFRNHLRDVTDPVFARVQSRVRPSEIGFKMDQFKDFPTTLTSPATNAQPVTPSDIATLSDVSRAIYVGQTGDVSVEMQSGQIVTFQNVQGGTILALRTLKIRQTGTTAVGIVAMW